MAKLRVRQIAQAQGLTISALSRRADLNYRTVYQIWNKPDYDASLSTLSKLAAALGVAVNELIENGAAHSDDAED